MTKDNIIFPRKTLVFFFLVLLASYLSQPIQRGQVFWDLTLGRWIWEQFSFVHTDIWTLGRAKYPITEVGWLFSVLCHFLEKAFGFVGLMVLKLGLFFLFLLALTFLYASRARSLFFGTLISTIVGAAILQNAELGSQILAWSLFLFTLEGLYRCDGCELRISKLTLLLGLICALYTNLHASVILLVVFAVIFTRRFYGALSGYTVAFSGLLASLISPHFGFHLFEALTLFLENLSVELIFRLSPATVFHYDMAFLILLGTLAVILGRAVSLPRFELVLCLTAAALGLGARSMLPFSLLTCGLLVSICWGQADGSLGELSVGIKRLQVRLRKFLSASPHGFAFVMICLAIVNTASLLKNPVFWPEFPKREASLILSRDLPFPLLHELGVGAYLSYRFSDEKGQVKRKVFARDKIGFPYDQLVELKALPKLELGWSKNFERAKPRSVLCRSSDPLFEYLKADPSWRLDVFAGVPVEDLEPADAIEKVRMPFVWAVFVAQDV